MFQNFVSIYLNQHLGNLSVQRTVEPGQFRPFARGLKESIGVFGEIRDVFAHPIFEHEAEAPGRSNAGDSGRRKSERVARRHPVELGVDRFHDGLNASLFGLPLVPRLQGDENKSAIGGVGLCEQAASHNRTVVLHAVGVFEHRFHFFGEGVRTLQRGCVGKLNIQIEKALIFGGKESGRQSTPNQKRGAGDRGKKRETDGHFSYEGARNADILLRSLLEETVESSEQPLQHTVGFVARLQQQ